VIVMRPGAGADAASACPINGRGYAMRKLLSAVIGLGLLATATPSLVASCRGAKGKCIKCGKGTGEGNALQGCERQVRQVRHARRKAGLIA
jgi:hypothetical protein